MRRPGVQGPGAHKTHVGQKSLLGRRVWTELHAHEVGNGARIVGTAWIALAAADKGGSLAIECAGIELSCRVCAGLVRKGAIGSIVEGRRRKVCKWTDVL